MALKGRTWFLGRALEHERLGRRHRLYALSARALDLGLLGKDSTRGHIQQAVGAVQVFLGKQPAHAALIMAAPPNIPFAPGAAFLTDWNAFLAANAGTYGRAGFGYDFDTLKGYLTPTFGGHRHGGGGGNNELKICLRLVPEF